MITADTPTLWDLRSHIGHAATIAILVKAFIHTAKMVSLDRNLTNEQIGEAANDTLEQHGQLKVEEIKFLLKRALRTKQIFGRLDYGVLMGWIEEYDAERTEVAISASEEVDKTTINALPAENAISFDEWRADLEERAKTDPEAAKMLAGLVDRDKILPPVATNERQKHIEFKQRYWQEYAKKK